MFFKSEKKLKLRILEYHDTEWLSFVLTKRKLLFSACKVTLAINDTIFTYLHSLKPNSSMMRVHFDSCNTVS